jgi:hypothetical protein
MDNDEYFSHHFDHQIDQLIAIAAERRRERGFEEFEVGHLVRMPNGTRWNRERDYVIATIYQDGFGIRPADARRSARIEQLSDADVRRLGMVHSPNQPQ